MRKGGIFHDVSKQIQKEYDTRDKPTNMVSDIAEGVIGTLPLMASMYSGAGEVSLATKAPQLFGKLSKVLATTGGLTAYKEATDKGEGYAESLISGAHGAVEGGLEGGFLEAQMLVGGAMGKGVVNKLTKYGLFKGGKATKAIVHALAVGTMFGGTSAGEDILSGREVDTDKVLKQFGSGLAYELIPTIKGIKDQLSDLNDGKKIDNNAAQSAAIANSMSNLNAESAIRTLINTPAEQLVRVKTDIPGTHEDLYAKSIESGAKAYEAKDIDEKKGHYVDQLVLKAQGDVKLIADRVAKDKQGMLDTINESEELTPEQKADLTDKINLLAEGQDNIVDPIAEEAPLNTEMTTQVETGLPTEEAHAEQNTEMDARITAFQQKFPEQQIDPLADLPSHVVRTFDRVEADIPTDLVAINEASDWLYGKYKELSAMKKADTCRLTLDQIDAVQHQLGEDITLLENHKTKYHGEEQSADSGKEAIREEIQTEPAKPPVNGPDAGAETGTTEIVANEQTTPNSDSATQVTEPAKPTTAEPSKADPASANAEIGDNKVADKPSSPIGENGIGIEKGQNTTAEITPQNIRANIKLASNEVSEKYGLRGSEGETLYNKFRDKQVHDPYEQSYTDPVNEVDAVKESDIPAILKKTYKALVDKDFLNEYDGNHYLTEEGKKYIDAVKARLETRKGIKQGTDLFPADAALSLEEVANLKTNLTTEEIKEADKLLAPEGITIKDIQEYEQSVSELSGGNEQQSAVESNAETIQKSENEPAKDAGEVTTDKGLEKPIDEKQAAILKEIEDAKKEFNDFIKSSRKNINSVGGALGQSFEFIGKAGKLLAAYSKLGIYKFGELVSKMREDFGDEFVDENIHGIKGAYSALRSGIPKEERANFDNEDAVDAYVESLANEPLGGKKESPAGPEIKAEPRDDSANLKTASLKKKSLQSAIEREAPKDNLLKEFTALDPRYFTPDEVDAYNELTKDKNPGSLQRDAIAKFIDDFHGRQEEDAAKRERDWYKQIEEDEELSKSDAKDVLREAAETTEETPDLENTVQDKKAKNAFSKIITQYKKQLRGFDVSDDMGDVKKALTEIDESKLSTKLARDVAKIMDNILYDGNYAGAGRVIALNEAITNAKVILEDLTKRGFDKGDISQFWADFRTLDQNVEMISKSTKAASVIQDKSGIQKISAGNAKVNKLMNDLSKEYNAMTDKMGKDILSVENRYKRGILASILQVADKDLPEVSFARYKNYIKETGEILSKSKIKSEQKEGELVTDLYNKFLDGRENAQAVIEAITKDNPNNTRLVNFFVKKFEGAYGDLRRNTLLYSGKDLPFITQYTPTQMKLLKAHNELSAPDVSITSPLSFDGREPGTDTQGSRTTINRKDLKTLKGTRRVLNLNFDGVAFDKYRETNYDIQTMGARHLYDTIRKLGDFKDALGGKTNVNVISNGVSQMVRRQKGFNRSSPEARAVVQALNVATAKGVRIALQGTSQFLKQYPSVGFNTLANLGKDADLYFKSIAKFGINHPIFDKSGIGLRAGQHGGTTYELELKKLKNTDFSGSVTKSLSALSSIGDKLSSVFGYALTKADDAVARNSWGAYYMKDLRKQGINVDEVDWDTEHQHINEEAAAYAEQMVSRNQIQNDPSKQANFLYGGDVESGKDLGAHVLKGIAFPFSSFARNAQARLESDLRKFSGGDRKEAVLSLVSGMIEATAFNALKIAVIGSVANWAANKVLPQFGFSPSESDDKGWQIPAQALNDMLLAGFGSIGDKLIIKGINRVVNPENDKVLKKYLVPEYNSNDFGEPDFGIFGIYGILPNKFYDAYQEFDYIDGNVTGLAYNKKTDKNVNYQSQLSDRQKALARMVFTVDVLGLLGVSDADVLQINQKIFREIKKEKSPIKYHHGYNRNTIAEPTPVKK